MSKRIVLEACVSLAFFVSGAAALTFEALFFDEAGLAFGNDVWASSAVLSAFMLGMAAGYFAAGRFGRRLATLRAFAALEALAALSGVAVVSTFGFVESHFAALFAAWFEHPLALNTARVLCAFVLFAIPSAAMGASLPALTGALAPLSRGYGRVLGLLYGANTAGGVLGVLAAEMLFVPRHGLRATALVAASAELAVACAAFFAAPRAATSAVPDDHEGDGQGFPWLACTFVAGASLLGLEVVWTRVLTLFIDDTSSAFASILAVVLAGIAAGGALSGAWLHRRPDAIAYTSLVAYASGAAGVAGYLLYPLVLRHSYMPEAPPFRVAIIAAPLVLPAAVGSGALFTLAGAGMRRAVGSGVVATSHVAAMNTIGGALGAVIAGFVLLPWLGMQRALSVLLALYGGAALAVGFRGRPLRPARWVELGVFAAIIAAVPLSTSPDELVEASARRWMRRDDHIVEVRESRTGTLVHIRHEVRGLPICDQIVTNAYSMTSNDFLARRYMKFFVYLPVAVETRVRSALLLGYGMGNTAKALVDTKELERIDVVDVSPEMLELSRDVQPRRVPEPLDDPRVTVHVGDARYFLRSTSEEYDLITGEPPPPVMAHVANLYSAEYFALVRDRLRPGGMATYWLPTMNLSATSAKAIVAAFCDAFAECSLWNGAKENFVLVGTRGAPAGVDDARFVAQWRDPDVVPELRNVGLEFPGQLGAMFIGDAEYLRGLVRDVAPLTDDFPHRITVKGDRDERLRFIAAFRDTKAARDRFGASLLVAAMFPPGARRQSLVQFENQRLWNDLTFNGPTGARKVEVLDQVLTRTPLRTMPLLILGSDSDFRRAIASAPDGLRRDPALVKHAIASALSMRDAAAALALAEDVPEQALPLSGLRRYLEDLKAGEAP